MITDKMKEAAIIAVIKAKEKLIADKVYDGVAIHNDGIVECTIAALEAALEAAPVIFLEEGAEPQVGDMVAIRCGEYGIVTKLNGNNIRFRLSGGMRGMRDRAKEDCTITQRNNLPVITINKEKNNEEST